MIRQLHVAPAVYLALLTLLAVAVTLVLMRHGALVHGAAAHAHSGGVSPATWLEG